MALACALFDDVLTVLPFLQAAVSPELNQHLPEPPIHIVNPWPRCY